MDINIQRMTIEEKLKTMELLWDDICHSAINFNSPHWHEQILKKREESISGAKDEFIDWTQAKSDIRKEIE